MERSKRQDSVDMLTNAIDKFSEDSGEKPSVLVKLDGDEVLCHSSVLRLNCPTLLEKIEDDILLENEIHANMMSVLYFLYTGKLEIFNADRFDLIRVAIFLNLGDLANRATKLICGKLANKGNWTCVTGDGEGHDTFLTGMDDNFNLVLNNFFNGNYNYWDFHGKSLNCDITPRQIGMVENEVNYLEFDQKTFYMMKKSGIEFEDKKFVKIDFELSSFELSSLDFELSSLSNLVKDSLLWRIKIVLPKSLKRGKAAKVGLYLLASGVNEWSCNISGNLILVNQVDRTKDIVRSINTTLSHNASDWGYENMFKMEDITDLSKGFVKDGVIICKARVLTDECKTRYTQMLEMRKQKQAKGDEEKDKRQQVKGKKQNSKEKLTKSMESETNDMNLSVDEQIPCKICNNPIQKVEIEVKNDTKFQCEGKEEMKKQDLGLERKELVESVVNDMIATAVCGSQLDRADNERESQQQGLCQSLPLADVSTKDTQFTEVEELQDVDKRVSWDDLDTKTKRKKKKRVPRERCSLPSCNARARHRCSRCLEVKFCSQECSDQHWVDHREQCNIIRERKERDRQEVLD